MNFRPRFSIYIFYINHIDKPIWTCRVKRARLSDYYSFRSCGISNEPMSRNVTNDWKKWERRFGCWRDRHVLRDRWTRCKILCKIIIDCLIRVVHKQIFDDTDAAKYNYICEYVICTRAPPYERLLCCIILNQRQFNMVYLAFHSTLPSVLFPFVSRSTRDATRECFCRIRRTIVTRGWQI